MVHLDIEPDPGAWFEWAVSHNIAPEVIGFIRFSPEMLFDLVEGECERGWPSPRSWENVSKVLSYGLDDEELSACVEGLVGEVAATQFYAFSEHSKELGDIRAMMLDQTKKMKVPTEQDILYAIATNLAYWLRRGGETVEESEKMLDGFFRIGLQLPPAFATVAMVDALSGKDGEHLAKRLTEHKRFPDWQKKFAVDKKKKGL